MLLFLIYLGLTTFLSPLIFPTALLNGKIRHRLLYATGHNRRTLKSIKSKRGTKPIILLHAASAGEFEQLVPILQGLDRDRFFVLLSFMSPTIFRKQWKTELADAVVYHPLDFWWLAITFFNKIRPIAYIVNRHDIWPAHLFFAKRFSVKTILINANLHEKSLRLVPGFRSFNRHLFCNFDLVCTGTERLKQRLLKLTSEEKVKITGETRVNRVLVRKTNNDLPCEFKKFSASKNIILGSLIKSDFGVVFGGLKLKFPSGMKDLAVQNSKIIIVPHEPEKSIMKEIIKFLDEWNVKWEKLTQFSETDQPAVLIVDEVGLLGDIYQIGRCSYVGAGFGEGVHSVLEPAVHGCPVSFGPNIHILDEAIDLYESNLGTMVRTKEEFKAFLSFLEDDVKYVETSRHLKAFVENRKCNIQSIIQTITA